MLYIPTEKLHQIRLSVQYWMSQQKISKKQLQSLIGKISWGAKCIKAIRPILRSLIDLQTSLSHSSHRVRIPAYVKKHLAFYDHWCSIFNGVSFASRLKFLPDTMVFTDSSLDGGAAYCNKDFIFSAWKADFPKLQSHPIFVKELFAILLAFHRWPYHWRDKSVQIHTDNKGAEWAIRKGLTKNCAANAIVHEILWIAALFNIDIHMKYIASADNCVADALSRMTNFQFLVLAIKFLWNKSVDISQPGYNLLHHMSYDSYKLVFT